MHARAIQRLRQALGAVDSPKSTMAIIREAVCAFQQKPRMLKAQLATRPAFANANEDLQPTWARMPLAMAAEKPRPRRTAKKTAHGSSRD